MLLIKQARCLGNFEVVHYQTIVPRMGNIPCSRSSGTQMLHQNLMIRNTLVYTDNIVFPLTHFKFWT